MNRTGESNHITLDYSKHSYYSFLYLLFLKSFRLLLNSSTEVTFLTDQSVSQKHAGSEHNY